ncbi:hypothetical protein M1446_03965 [Candidatus Dependentiae bacterium]|nr:hypothetical protein [Candidatus Dependentiae bacterium]
MLYYTYGLVPIIAGLDKYFHYLVDWSIYLNDTIPAYLGLTSANFLILVGIIEIIAGLLVFFKPRLGGYIVCAWLIAISINLITMGKHTHHGYTHLMTHYDIALRDIAMAVGAYVFVLLSKELNK